jgi:hypothetical protein
MRAALRREDYRGSALRGFRSWWRGPQPLAGEQVIGVPVPGHGLNPGLVAITFLPLYSVLCEEVQPIDDCSPHAWTL